MDRYLSIGLAVLAVAYLKASGAESLLVVDAGRRTTVKTRFISGSQQLLRCDEEDVSPYSGAVEDALIAVEERAEVARFGIRQ